MPEIRAIPPTPITDERDTTRMTFSVIEIMDDIIGTRVLAVCKECFCQNFVYRHEKHSYSITPQRFGGEYGILRSKGTAFVYYRAEWVCKYNYAHCDGGYNEYEYFTDEIIRRRASSAFPDAFALDI